MRSLLREPLVHFLVLGAALFALHRWVAPAPAPDAAADGRDPILLTDSLETALAARHQRQTGRAPDPSEREALLAAFRRDEALYREARRLGLEGGDEIVRRRLVQKMEFLLRGSLAVPEPTEDELEAYLAAHAEELARPARVAFRHVFFSRDRRGESARADAVRALEGATPEGGPGDAGDPFLLGAEHGPVPERVVAERFGAPFATALLSAPLGTWSGPISSSYGQHLVLVTAREEARPATLDEVREEVRRAEREEREDAAFEEAVDALVASYPVTTAESP